MMIGWGASSVVASFNAHESAQEDDYNDKEELFGRDVVSTLLVNIKKRNLQTLFLWSLISGYLFFLKQTDLMVLAICAAIIIPIIETLFAKKVRTCLQQVAHE
jgi:hypothetical protein